MTDSLFVGLMSGTSVDGVDAALVKIGEHTIELLHCRRHPLPAETREAVHALCTPGAGEIDQLGVLDRQLGQCFAEACLALLREAGVEPGDVAAIGSHGQTVRHRPASSIAPHATHAATNVATDAATSAETNTTTSPTTSPTTSATTDAATSADKRAEANPAFSLQLGDPNTIAENTGIVTVADFRRRDIAAGGEGAPLAPAFHRAMFGQPGKHRAVVNIGGIANISLLAEDPVRGFDCGPGNTLLDQWAHRHTGRDYDSGGEWAAGGEVIGELLKRLLADPWFSRPPPKSTGREAFNLDWLERALEEHAGAELSSRDVQATLAELTASGIARSLAFASAPVEELYVCGGGAANSDLMERIRRLAAPARLGTTAELGCDPDWVEAAAFAWLAYRRLNGLPGNIDTVTGARGPRVLGAVYPCQ